MAEPQILTTLRNKRDVIERVILRYEAKIKAARIDLAHVNATMQIFQLNGEMPQFPLPASISRLFRRGELFGYCTKALEAAPGGLDTRELARAIIRAKGMDEEDGVLRHAVAMAAIWTLDMRAKRGQIMKAGKRKGLVVWRLLEPTKPHSTP